MATIFYGVMGEGRGHAARARSMTEQLRSRHRIVLYTSHDALAFLRNEYDTATDVEVREIPGVKFHYIEERLALRKTIGQGLAFWWNRHRLARPILADIKRDKPSLIVSDFEPLVAKAAHRAGVPVMSLDHQHFLVAYDLTDLPWIYRWRARSMRLAVWMFNIAEQKSVVSAFYHPPLRSGYEHMTQVGPLLRPAIRGQQPTQGDYLLAYLRRQTPNEVVDMLSQLALPIRIYGLGERPLIGNAKFFAVDESSFTEALVECRGVVAAAGNQLLGEALYLEKPFFALPEKKHFEQCINAHFLKSLGGGDWACLEDVQREDLDGFIAQLPTYHQNLKGRQEEFDGTEAAAAEIEAMLDRQ